MLRGNSYISVTTLNLQRLDALSRVQEAAALRADPRSPRVAELETFCGEELV